jgi:hypothetical protein
MKYLVFISSLFFSLSVSLSAQSFINLTSSMTLTPEHPKPYTTVNVKYESYSFDVDRALITWSVNGTEVLSGIGERSLKVPLGGEGSITRVSVVVRPNEGGTVRDQILITPAFVSLVWEASDTYVPPLYKGKALPSEGGLVKVVALPSFYSGSTPYNPKTINYQWSVNGENIKALSGVGKQTLDTKLNYFENENIITVVASTFDGLQTAEESITIAPTSLSPRFYIYDPLFGVDYSKSYTKRIEITKPTSFVYEPYYISNKDITSPNIETSWSLNGLPVEPDEYGILSITPKQDSSGVGTLLVTIEQTKKYLQKAESALQVVFDTRK